MNDPVDRAFKHLHEADVPEGPPEEMIQATLRSIDREIRNVANHRRMRRRRLSMAVAAAALVVFCLTFFALQKPEPQQVQRQTVNPQPPVKSSTNVASAFIEADQLQAGQTFLLPLDGSAVCIDPATWPDDLLTINSLAER